MIAIVRDPENYSLEELAQMYITELGFDRKTAEAYAAVLKGPPEGVDII